MECATEFKNPPCPRCDSSENVVTDQGTPGKYWCRRCHNTFMSGQVDLNTIFNDALKMDKKDKYKELLLGVGRQNMPRLIQWLESTDFFKAPASSKIEFHGCYEGGLLNHHLNVLDLFRKRVNEFGINISNESIIICSLLHDVCKANLYHGSGQSFTYDPVLIKEGHAKKSLKLIKQFLELSKQEENIIAYHMGFWQTYEVWASSGEYSKDNLITAIREDPAVLLFHHCDDEAGKFLETN